MVAKESCTGCLACYNACPTGAIKVSRADFSVSIDSGLCVDCGKCKTVCPENKDKKVIDLFETREVVAAAIKDEAVRKNSSSGGVSSALSQVVLNNGGVVYGAVWNAEWNVIHTRVSETKDLSSLYGSKYVHSNVGFIYRDVCVSLDNCNQVLFFGTPCQIAGLRSYLGKNYDNLYTVEMICHGIGDPFLFEAYIRDYHSKSISSFNMRSKNTGWTNCSFCFDVEYTDGSSYRRHNKREPYMIAFANDICLHESCYKCRYRNLRAADLSIGDCWGIEHTQSKLNDNKGASRVYINTLKGKALMDIATEYLNTEPISKPQVVSGPLKIRHNMKRRFVKNLEKHGFRKALWLLLVPLYADKLLRRLNMFFGRKSR